MCAHVWMSNSQRGVILPIRGHLVTSGDLLLSKGVGSDAEVWWVEGRNVANVQSSKGWRQEDH